MITKDNIAEVLKHNGWESSLISDKTIHVRDGGSNTMGIVYFAHPNWLQSIELLTGKLEPLPEPNLFAGKWVKSLFDSDFFQGNKWYEIYDGNTIDNHFYVYESHSKKKYIGRHKDFFDLTDIRDYNPDEEIVLKVGDKILNYAGLIFTLIKFDYVNKQIIYMHDNYKMYGDFITVNKIKLVNGRQGKFVIPLFDFAQTLLDAGFTQGCSDNYIKNNNGLDLVTSKTTFCFSAIRDVYYECNPANAKRLIEAAAILNELELAE